MPPKRTSLSQAREAFLAFRKPHVATNTFKRDEYTTQRIITFLGNLYTDELTPQMLHEWATTKRPKGVTPPGRGGGVRTKANAGLGDLSPAGFNVERAHAKAWLLFMERRGLLGKRHDGAPMTAETLLEEFLYKKIPDREPTLLTGAQMLQMVESAEHGRDRFLLALLMGTGMRGSDATALRWGNIKWERGRGYARFVFIMEKTEKRIDLKTDPGLYRELLRWEEEWERLAKRPHKNDDYVIPAKTPYAFTGTREGGNLVKIGGGFLRPNHRMGEVWTVVQRELEKLGLDTKQQGGHTFRRSALRHVVDRRMADGYDNALRTAQTMAGHSTMAQTEKYIGMTREQMELDRFLDEDLYGAEREAMRESQKEAETSIELAEAVGQSRTHVAEETEDASETENSTPATVVEVDFSSRRRRK